MAKRPKQKYLIFFAIPLVIALVVHAAATYYGSCIIMLFQQKEIVKKQNLYEQIRVMRDDVENTKWLLAQRAAAVSQEESRSNDANSLSESQLMDELVQLQHEMGLLNSKIREIDHLENEVSQKRRSRDELQQDVDHMKDLIENKTKEVKSIQEQILKITKDQRLPETVDFVINQNAVFAECINQGVRILPEGKVLPDNPGIKDIVYLKKKVQEIRAVYFLVRPSGYESFDYYRRVVKGLRQSSEFNNISIGYEPIPDKATIQIKNEDGKCVVIISYAK